jgi:TP901 family phage tail tape measure protein
MVECLSFRKPCLDIIRSIVCGLWFVRHEPRHGLWFEGHETRRGSVRTDIVNLQVNVGNNAAQNQMNELRKKAFEVRAEMENLGKRTKEFGEKKRELTAINAEMDKLKKTIGITALTQKELVMEQKKLLALRNSLPPFTAEWKKYELQLRQVKDRLYDVNNGVRGFASLWSRVGDEVKKFGMVAAGYLGFQFITSTFQSLISGAGKLSDSLADIRKVTGLTVKEVDDLNRSLKKIDTRTANSELRDLAYQAGKLGIAGKENILAFVRAADQIQVALGRDLGDDATLAIGKIATVYKAVEQFGVEEGLLKIGSAINAIGMSSAAQEQYIVNFTRRLGGIAVPADISAAEIIGLAGTMDSLGATAEVSTTAIGNTISKLVADFKGFAQISGLTEDALRKVFSDQGGLGALRAVLEGVQKSGGNFEVLIAKLGDIGIDGSRAKAVLGLLANNLDELDRQIKISNQAFEEGTSVTNEFNIKNETLGATLDKLSKAFNRMVTSTTVINFVKGLVENTYGLIKALSELPKWINNNSTALKLLIGGIIMLNAHRMKAIAIMLVESKALKTLAIDINLTTLAQKASAIATNAWGVVVALFTGNIRMLQKELKLLRVLMGANPLGIFLIALGAAVLLVNKLRKEIDGLTAAERARVNIQKQAVENTVRERAELTMLTAVAKDNSLSLETRQSALKELIALSPEYLNGLTLENIATREGSDALKAYNDQLIAKAAMAASLEKVSEIAKKDLDLAQKQRDLEKQRATTPLRVTGRADRTNLQDLDDSINYTKAKRAELRREQDAVIDLQKEFREKLGKEITPTGASTETEETEDLAGKIIGDTAGRGKKIRDFRADFIAFYQQLQEDLDRAGLSDRDLAVFNAQKAANEQLQKLRDFFNKGVVGADEFTTGQNIILDQLERQIREIDNKFKNQPKELANTAKNIAKFMLPSPDDLKGFADKAFKDLNEIIARGNRDRIARLDLAFTNARGGREKLEALIVALQEERRQILLNTDLTEGERLQIIAQYEERIANERKNYLMQAMQDWVGVVQQAANLLGTIADKQMQKDQQAFNREKRINDQRKKLVKDQYDNRLISEAVYQKKLAELNELQDRNDAELKRKQFERAKKIQITQALIAGAQAIVSTLAAVPGPLDIASLGIARAAQIGFAIATTAAQVNMISKQQPPEYARGGLLRRGPKHRDKQRGLHVVNPETGQVEALVERNEAILSSNTMNDGTVYQATGTPAQIASTLNGINGGATWTGPAMVRPITSAPAWATSAPARVKGPRMYADGGIMNSTETSVNPAMNALAESQRETSAQIAALRQDVQNWNTRLHAVVSIKEYRETEALYDASIASSGL